MAKFVTLPGGRIKCLKGTVGGPKADRTQILCFDPSDLGRRHERRMPMVEDDEFSPDHMPSPNGHTAPLAAASADESGLLLVRRNGARQYLVLVEDE